MGIADILRLKSSQLTWIVESWGNEQKEIEKNQKKPNKKGMGRR